MRATASLGFVFYSAMEPCADGRSSSEEVRPAPGRVRAGALARVRQPRATGRLVESTQAEDRRLIALVGERPLLYARSTLPVASYYSQVKTLWQEVADLMGWTVAEVRRKWSHIRNSYSRHLRNEIHGMRTGRGRMVSRWYLADDLEFLRQHMATDTRPSSYSMVQQFAPTLLELECGEQQNMVPTAASWYAAPEPLAAPSDDSCTYNNTTSTTDSDDDYFHFFRGLYSDYQELTPAVQRKFRRQCLLLLHELVDATDGAGGARSEHSDAEDSKGFVHDLQINAELGPGDHDERGDSNEERGDNHEERGESHVDGDDGVG